MRRRRRIKIIATLGPASADRAVVVILSAHPARDLRARAVGADEDAAPNLTSLAADNPRPRQAMPPRIS